MTSNLKFIQFDAESRTRNSWSSDSGGTQNIGANERTVPSSLDQGRSANEAVVQESGYLQVSTDTIEEIRRQYHDNSLKNNQFMTKLVEHILNNFVPKLLDTALTLSVLEHARLILSQYQGRKLHVHVPRNRMEIVSALFPCNDDDVVTVCDEQLTDNSAAINFGGCRLKIDFDQYFENFSSQVKVFLEEQKIWGKNEFE